MSAIIWAILGAILGAFLLSFGSVVAIIKYATNTGKMLDRDAIKKPQKMHFGDIPRAGGVGIFAGFCVCVAVLSAFEVIKAEYIYLLIPSFFIFFSGFWEDLNNSISPKIRLFLQTIGSAGAIFFFQNCVITDIGFSLPYGFGVVWTLFCIVGVVNAINIIDGFNGLASGCVILMMTSIAIVAHLVGNGDIFCIALVVIGATLGFFVWNFPRGRIFLGDGGAYLLGFLLAFLLVSLTQSGGNFVAESALFSAESTAKLEFAESTPFSAESTAKLEFAESNSATLPQESHEKSLKNAIFNNKVSAYYGLCIAIYPVFEVLFSIWRRRVRKLQAMQPDCIHLHTLIFRRITRSNAKTSALLWLLNAPFIFLPVFFYSNATILIALIGIFALLYIALYKKITRFKRLFKADNLKI